MKKISWMFLICGAAFIACEKITIPDPEIEEPVFVMSMNAGDLQLQFGGIHTKVVSEIDRDELGIRIFENSFVNTEEEYSLTFRLRDNRVSNPDISDDTIGLFKIGDVSFLNKRSIAENARILFNRALKLAYYPYLAWTDAVIADTIKGTGFYVRNNFDRNSNNVICLSLRKENEKCETTYCKWWTFSDGDIPLLGFETKGNTIWPVIHEAYTKPLKYIWNGKESPATYEVSNSGKHEVRMFYENTIAEVEMQLHFDEEGILQQPCFTPFSSNFYEWPYDPALGTIEVVYTDKNGTVFSSAGNAQPFNASFKVSSISPADIRNQEGQRVQKLEVIFSCTLFGPDNQNIHIQEGKGVIAFSYY